MRAILKAVAVAAILAVSPVMLAQQEGLRDRDPVLEGAKKVASDLQAATIHYGPWYLLSRVTISDLGYGQQYFTPTGASSGGLTIAASAPQRLYLVPSRRVVFSGEVNPQYAWIQQNGAKNQFGYSTRGDAEFILNHVFLDLYGSQANELRPMPGEINRIVTVKERNAGLSTELKYSSRTSALFTALYRDEKYPLNRLQPAELRAILPLLMDRTEHNYRLSAIHKTFPVTSIIVAAEQSDYAFAHTPSRDSRREYVGAGAVLDNGTTILRVEAGPGKLTFKQAGPKEFKGLLANAALNHRVGERWRIGVNAARDLDFSLYQNNNYYIVDRLSGAVDYAATRRLSLRFTSEYGRDLYDMRIGAQPLRRDQIAWNAIGWTYALRRVRGGFDVGYYHRNSNVPDVDEVDGIRMVVHLSFTP